jgi:hypothetical protein
LAQRKPLSLGALFLVVAALLCALLTAWGALVSFAIALGYQHPLFPLALGYGLVLGLALCMATLAISRFRKGPLGPGGMILSALIGAGFVSLGLWSLWQDPGDAFWIAPPTLAAGAVFILLAVESHSAR